MEWNLSDITCRLRDHNNAAINFAHDLSDELWRSLNFCSTPCSLQIVSISSLAQGRNIKVTPARRQDSRPFLSTIRARHRKLCSYSNSVVNLPAERVAAVSNYRTDFDSLRLSDISRESGSILRFFWVASPALRMDKRNFSTGQIFRPRFR